MRNGKLGRRTVLGGAALAAPALLLGGRARADSPVYRIGLLNDQSGTYAAGDGPGSFATAKMAVEDFMKAHPDFRAEVIVGDMSTSVDTATTIARGWYDQNGVDAIIGLPQSAAAISVGTIAKQKDKLVVFTGAGVADLTGKYCNENQIHWTYDLWVSAHGTCDYVTRTGGDTWYFITADYISGHAMQSYAEEVIKGNGGKVLGGTFYAFPGTTDFSSALIAAQASGARVIGFGNAGDDTTNCIKQAREFGISGKTRLACLVFSMNNIEALGLAACQGVTFVEAFYWDANDDTRAFARRFTAQYPNRRPTMFHAGAYSATLHILKAAAAVGMDRAKASGRSVADEMKTLPTEDPVFGKGYVRKDGKFIHDTFVWEVKSPSESKYAFDWYKQVARIPGEEAFMSMERLGCAFAKA
jgi:branched-chain amino acid transport system substrate-binding protein